MKTSFVLMITAALLAQPAIAQNAPFCAKDDRAAVRAFCKDLADLQQAVNAGTATNLDNASNFLNKLDLADVRATVKFITAAADATAVHNLLSKVADSSGLRDAGHLRPDRELSAPPTSAGTTSLVSRPGSAELLALALDSGVLTRSVNGTTATLSTNADQIFRLITGSDPDCTVSCKDLGWVETRILNMTSVSASMDLSQTNNKTVPTSGPAGGITAPAVTSATIPSGTGRVSAVKVRYELLNRFDPRSQKFKESWRKAIQTADLTAVTVQLGDASESVGEILSASATPLNREDLLKAAQGDSTGKTLADTYAAYFEHAVAKPLENPELGKDVAAAVQARALYRQAWLAALHQAVGNLVTFEYDFNRPANQPFTHDFKLVYSYNTRSLGMLTFNGAVSVYDSIPVAARYGRTHYGQVSAQYDRNITGKDAGVATQLSLAGYWQYQPEPSVLDIPAGNVAPGTNIPVPNGTQEFVGTAGSLFVTQLKLTIKGSGGINVPIGVSWSNKTDLLQGSKVGAQVGISYNFTSLANLFRGGAF